MSNHELLAWCVSVLAFVLSVVSFHMSLENQRNIDARERDIWRVEMKLEDLMKDEEGT